MKTLRTPDERFGKLPDYPFEPRYTEIDGLRIHHVEAGSGPVVLMLHGEPTWSFLYRKMIPPLAEAGYRAIAPDLVGFGRSDKPAAMSDYSYARHVEWMRRWIEANDLGGITLFADRHRHGPPGLAGGGPGKRGRAWIVSDAARRPLSAKGTETLAEGDRVRIETPGGGGWRRP